MRDKFVAQRAYYGVRSRPLADLRTQRSERQQRALTGSLEFALRPLAEWKLLYEREVLP